MNPPDSLRKTDVVRTNLERLKRIPQGTYDEFASDFRNTETSLHLLQTAIQALLDIGSGACARLGLDTARTSFEILERLEQAGRLPAGSANRYAPVVGFSNRVVHLYDRIDPQIVWRVVTERRSDLLELLESLLAYS